MNTFTGSGNSQQICFKQINYSFVTKASLTRELY